jgi:hypothetical protein
MLFFRRYPRFTFLLSFLLTASLLLLLAHSPFPSLQPSSAPPTRPLNSTTSFQGLAARVRRAERAYQKMLLGRDALIAKVGPAPHNVALCVPPHPVLILANCLPSWYVVFHQIRSRGHRILFVSPSLCCAQMSAHWMMLLGDFFPPAFFCPHELERVGDLGDGGKWVCGLSQLQEKEDCVVYSVGTTGPSSSTFETR